MRAAGARHTSSKPLPFLEIDSVQIKASQSSRERPIKVTGTANLEFYRVVVGRLKMKAW